MSFSATHSPDFRAAAPAPGPVAAGAACVGKDPRSAHSGHELEAGPADGGPAAANALTQPKVAASVDGAGPGGLSAKARERVPSPTLAVSFAVLSEPGIRDGAPKINQDRCFVKLNLLGHPHMHLFGVADGHGACGHDVSTFVADAFPRAFEALLSQSPVSAALTDTAASVDPGEWEQKLFPALAGIANRACHAAEDQLFAAPHVASDTSGTTLVAMLLVRGQVLVVNVGDSVACVFRSGVGTAKRPRPGGEAGEGPDGAGRTQRLHSAALSAPHKPSTPAERRRISQSGGCVAPRLVTGPDGMPAPTGPHRVWSPAMGWRGPGLAMSRSVGDKVATDVGVIADPLVVSQSLLDQGDITLVLASDGVSDALGTRGMARALEGAETAEGGVSAIMCAAKRKWMRAEEEGGVGGAGEEVDPAGVAYMDDLSAIVLHLTNQ